MEEVPCDAPDVHIVSSGNVLIPELLIYYSPEAELLSIKHDPSLNTGLPTEFSFSCILADLCITYSMYFCLYRHIT